MTEPGSPAIGVVRAASSRAPSIRSLLIGVLLLAGVVVVPGAYLWSQLDRPAQVTGTVLAIRARPPLGVDSFDLLARDGRRLTFKVGPLDISPGGFDAPHLLTHQATGQAVVVSYRTEGNDLVAVRLADGPLAAAPPSAEPSASPTGSG